MTTKARRPRKYVHEPKIGGPGRMQRQIEERHAKAGPVPVPSRWGVPDPDICRKRAPKPPSRRAVAERVYEALTRSDWMDTYPEPARTRILTAIERAIGEAVTFLDEDLTTGWPARPLRRPRAKRPARRGGRGK